MYVHLSIPQMIKGLSGNLIECGDFTWRVSDCEELVNCRNYRNYRSIF